MRVLLFSKESAGRSVGFVRCRIQFDTAGNAAFELDEDASNAEDTLQRFRNLGWLCDPPSSPKQASGSVVEDDASTEGTDDVSSDEVVEDDTGDAPIASSTSKPKTKNQKKHKR